MKLVDMRGLKLRLLGGTGSSPVTGTLLRLRTILYSSFAFLITGVVFFDFDELVDGLFAEWQNFSMSFPRFMDAHTSDYFFVILPFQIHFFWYWVLHTLFFYVAIFFLGFYVAFYVITRNKK
jgi:hypothetical protein